MPALQPVEPPYDDETNRLLEAYPKRDGYLLKLFRVLASSKRHLQKVGSAGLLDRGSPLAIREREIVILRTTANLHCKYEWGVHVAAFAAHVGLTPEQVAGTAAADRDVAWNERERLLVSLVDGLCAGTPLDVATLCATRATWSEAEQLEIAALVGFYHTISNVVALAELDAEPWAAPFPASR
jgi:alkylhydroperoxidase family enzyme